MICKVCGKSKGEDGFYLKGHYVNGKYYVGFDKTCKKCHSVLRKMKIQELQEENKMPKVIEETNNNYGWVLRNLKKFGNCYIKHIKRIDISELEQTLNRQISVRRTFEDNQGYILEIKKEIAI